MKIWNSTYPEVEECVRKWFFHCHFSSLNAKPSYEIGLFFQCLPNKTAAFKGEECHGGKQSKLRVTVLLAANQSGKEKLPPLVIGRSKKPSQGIIRSFKVGYIAQIVRRLLDSIGEGKPCASINFLPSIRMTDYAWRNVAETIIKKCFIKAGFSENKTSSETEVVDSIKHSIGEINPEQWSSIQKDCNTNISFEDFLDVDNKLQMYSTYDR
ncbi:hypothetical protein AVEN_156698-1 [Araneus ventricosus]|uniref:DDE-1 domain-containing protein n=1 Tax=Araneus ventricosus TaxID=182803 RepID=A0A4Y2SBT8_ARAVE|nr:hypothetical protein AVEN_156698-1 [Araneus ventricosus]